MNEVFHEGLQAQVKLVPACRAVDPDSPVPLQVPLRGAQAALFESAAVPGQLMKIFHPGQAFPDLETKLSVLQQILRGVRGVVQVEHLLYAYAGGPCVGYAMKEVKGARYLADHHYSGARERVEIALRLSEVLFALQLKGCGPTDLHDKNVLIGPKGHVTVIDVDSFFFLQRNFQGSRIEHHPQLGTLEYSAPELIGEPDVRHTHHTAAHSLAVNLYKILKDAHPGDLTNPSGTKIPFQTAFAKGLYGRFVPQSLGLTVSDAGIPWVDLPHQIRESFKRAFAIGLNDPDARPLAQEWTEALAEWQRPRVISKMSPWLMASSAAAACLLIGMALGRFSGNGQSPAASEPQIVRTAPTQEFPALPEKEEGPAPIIAAEPKVRRENLSSYLKSENVITSENVRERDRAARTAMLEAKRRLNPWPKRP